MKKNILLFLLLVFSFNANSQKLNCNRVHIGKFELDSETFGKTEILRTKNLQIETNKFLDVKVQYDILWINDCVYELRNRKLLSGTSKYDGEPGDIIKVEILKIEKNKIFVRTSANFSEKTFETVINIVK